MKKYIRSSNDMWESDRAVSRVFSYLHNIYGPDVLHAYFEMDMWIGNLMIPKALYRHFGDNATKMAEAYVAWLDKKGYEHDPIDVIY